MPRLLMATALLLLLSSLPLRVGRGGEEDKIALPEDPTTVVVSLDYQGGLRPPRKVEGPMLSVRADGTVLAPDVWHGHGTGTISLSKDELNELLRFVVREQQFLELDEGGIKEEVRRATSSDGMPAPLDGVNTVVVVRLLARRKTLSWYALVEAAKRHPSVEGLNRLARVARRLERLRILTTAGGEKAVAGYLGLVNTALAKARSDAAPLTLADLKGAFLMKDGGRRIVFRRTEPGEERTFASVMDSGEGEPKVSVE